MLKFAEKIVKCRVLILVLSVLLLIPAAFGFLHTRINYDILYYLPDDIETMEGQNILLDEFDKGAYGIFVCSGMESRDVIRLAEKLEKVEHVADVLCYDSMTGGQLPTEVLPNEVKDIFYSKDGEGTLMFLFFDTTTSADETMDAVAEIRQLAGKQCFFSGMSGIAADTKNLVESEMGIYTIIAVLLVSLVLALTTDSYLIPVIFMLSIGMAIIFNLGSNVIQGEISYITMALVAILQLGVTMDYSIFLYNSYKEASRNYEDRKEAMAHAISDTMISVTGSSLTTIAGFLALCFMTFTLGLDMGIVMAKGVFIGVICCVTILPSLILVMDKAIRSLGHKPLQLRTKAITGFVVKHYRVLAVLMILLWIPAIYGNNRTEVYYKLDNSLPQYLPSRQANMELEENYSMNSVSMILVDADTPSKSVKEMTEKLEDIPGVNFALGMDSALGPLMPDEMLPQEVKGMLESDNWKLLLLSSEYQVGTDEANEQCDAISAQIKAYDKKAMLIGETAATKDLIDITDRDFKVVSIISIAAIFVLIFVVLKSVLLPVLLVAVIELAIYVNMGTSYYMGTTLPFIASICVGTIQLGATVDYAILMTTRYKTERLAGSKKTEAVKTALSTSMNSIFTSAMGFFAATVGVGIYSEVDLISAICILLARGALISMFIVICMLPAMLMIFDRLICHTTLDMRRLLPAGRKGGNGNEAE